MQILGLWSNNKDNMFTEHQIIYYYKKRKTETRAIKITSKMSET